MKNYFFRFNYEENQAGYFVAKNIDAINLSEDYYPGKGFTTIPMIVSKHPVYPNDRVYDNFEELENALKNDEYTLKWIGRMSNIQTCAREIVDNEMIYQ